VLRYWQWLLILSLVVPGLPIIAFLSAPSHLLTIALGETSGWLARLLASTIALGPSVGWIWLQRESVRGGYLTITLRALPFCQRLPAPWT
jgi:hypothetical protein